MNPRPRVTNNDTNDEVESEDEPNYLRTIAKEEIIPDADLEAERN